MTNRTERSATLRPLFCSRKPSQDVFLPKFHSFLNQNNFSHERRFTELCQCPALCAVHCRFLPRLPSRAFFRRSHYSPELHKGKVEGISSAGSSKLLNQLTKLHFEYNSLICICNANSLNRVFIDVFRQLHMSGYCL